MKENLIDLGLNCQSCNIEVLKESLIKDEDCDKKTNNQLKTSPQSEQMRVPVLTLAKTIGICQMIEVTKPKLLFEGSAKFWHCRHN